MKTWHLISNIFYQRQNRPAIEKLTKQNFAKGQTRLGAPADVTGINSK